jgi:glutamine amidotransferase class I
VAPVSLFESDFGAAVVSHFCPNDNTVEGLTCLDAPAFSVQYHPEAAAGPHDAAYLFDRFYQLMAHPDRHSEPSSGLARVENDNSQKQNSQSNDARGVTG